jgi:hypothetical protein
MSKRAIIAAAVVLVPVVVGLAFAAHSAKRRAESMRCGNNMASVGCAARCWALDHDGHLPPDFHSMANEVGTLKVLVCPGDHTRKPAASWSAFTEADSSYDILNPRLSEGDTNGVFMRCKIHGHLGYADGTVFDGVRRRTKIYAR